MWDERTRLNIRPTLGLGHLMDDLIRRARGRHAPDTHDRIIGIGGQGQGARRGWACGPARWKMSDNEKWVISRFTQEQEPGRTAELYVPLRGE